MEFSSARMIRPTSFLTSLPQSSAPLRPVETPVSEPEESLQLSGGAPRPRGGADTGTAVAATVAAAGGPIMLPLAQRLADLPVTFVLQRKWRLPFMSPTSEVSAEKAVSHLEEGGERLKVRLQPGQEPVAVRDSKDAEALEALHGQGQGQGLAAQLKSLQEQGLRFTYDGFPLEGYLAFQRVSQGQLLEVRQGELLLGHCDREGPRAQVQESLGQVERLRNDPLAALTHLSGLFSKDTRRVVQEMQRLETPERSGFKSLAGVFDSTSGSTPADRMSQLAKVSERVKAGPLADRLAFLQRIQHLGNSARSSQLQDAACSAYDALVEKGCPAFQAGEICGGVREVAVQQSYDRLTTEPLQQLASLAGQPVEHLKLYQEHVSRMEAPQAAKYVEFLAQPLGESSFQERSQAFEPVRRSGTMAWEAGHKAVQVQLSAGRSASEALPGLGRLLGSLKTNQEPRYACDAWSEHPDKLDSLCRLMKAGVSGQQAGPLLELSPSESGLQLLEKLGHRASAPAGKAFLEALERHGDEGLSLLQGLVASAPTRSEIDLAALGVYARDHLGGRPAAFETMGALLQRRIPVSEAGEVLEALESWQTELPLSQRLKAYADLVDSNRYYDDTPDMAGCRAPMARALGALVCQPVTPEQAVADLARLWRSAGANQWQAGLDLVADRLGSDREGCKLFLDLMEQRKTVAQAGQLLDLLEQPAPGTTRAERLQAFRDLSLEKASVGFGQALMRSLHRELAVGTSLGEAVTLLKGIPQPHEEGADAVGRHAGDRPAQEALVALMKGGLAGAPAAAVVERLKGRPGLQGAAGAMAGLSKARDLSVKTVEKLAESIQDGSQVRLASLTRLSQAVSQTRALSPAQAAYFADQVADSPAQTGLFAGLLEQRVPEGDLVGLFEAMRQPAGSTTEAERLEAFKAVGGLEPEDPYYSYRQVFKGSLQLAFFESLAAQLRAGIPLEEAREATRQLGSLGNRQAELILGEFSRDVAGRPPEERKLFGDLLNAQVTPELLRTMWDQVRTPLGETSLAERVGTLPELRKLSNSQEVQSAMLTMVRAEVEQGRSLKDTLALVGSAQQQVKWAGGEECCHAFKFAATLASQPRARDAFLEQLRHRVLPKVASQSLERAQKLDDLGRLEALRGLGQAGQKLSAQVANLVQDALDEKLRSGGERATVMATLGRLAETAGKQNLSRAAVEVALAHWSGELSGLPSANDVFCQLLEKPIPAGEAVSLEKALRPGPGEQALRLACLDQLNAFEQDYNYYNDSRKLVLDGTQRASLVGALQALLAAGQVPEEAVKELNASRSGLRREGLSKAWSSLAALASQQRPREVYRQLLGQHRDPELCDRILERFQRHGLEERLQAYTDLGLLRQQEPAVKERCLDVLQEEVEAGRPLGQATIELGELLKALGQRNESDKQAVLQVYPALAPERRQSLERLLLAALPSGVILSCLERFGPGHETALLGLTGYQRKLTLEGATRVQASLTTQGPEAAERLARVAAALAGREAPLTQLHEALDYSDTGPAGRSPLFGEVLALGGIPAEAARVTEQLLKVGGQANAPQRLEALKATGVFSPWAEGSAECAVGLNRVLVSQLLTGQNQESATEQLTKLVRALRLPSRWSQNVDVLRRLEGEPEKLKAWLPLAEAFSGSFVKAMERLPNIPLPLLERYPTVMAGGCRPGDALEILDTILQPSGRSRREERIAALDRLLEVNEQDRRSWLRKTMSSMMGRQEVGSHQCLSSLVRIYRKLTEFGRNPADAAEMVASIYATEQGKGVSHEALHKRLEELEEIARMDIRPDNNATVLLDKDGKIMFSGVTLKKRQPRPTPP